MTPSEMIDLALGRLEGPLLEQANQELQTDSALRDRCERLRSSIHLLMDDAPIRVPANLRRKTLAFVAERSNYRRRSILEFVPRTVPFRWTDLAVAAGIFLAGVITLLPALHRGKSVMSQAGCMFNLRQLGLGLGQYASAHQSYPSVQPNEYAVVFYLKLEDGGFVPKGNTSMDCPCAVRSDQTQEVHGVINQIRNPSQSLAPLPVKCDYAYNVGYRIDGKPTPVAARTSHMIPLLGDQPAFSTHGEILAGNSPNHFGRGQNILFQDQSVRWCRSRQILPGDGDIYLNNEQRPSYGLHEFDISLVPGALKVQAR